jgi:hypothetical protein
MKFLKSLLMGTGGVVLAGLVLALLAPKAVHAVVATAVQVVNTSANPAITEDTSRQASQIVTINCQVALGSATPFCRQALSNGGIGTPGPNGGYVVPANQSFVLKSMDTTFSSSPVSEIAIYFYNNAQNSVVSVEAVMPAADGQISFSSGIAVGPGMEVVPHALSPNYVTITLHGYLTSN